MIEVLAEMQVSDVKRGKTRELITEQHQIPWPHEMSPPELSNICLIRDWRRNVGSLDSELVLEAGSVLSIEK